MDSRGTEGTGRDVVHLRGWYHAEGIATVRADRPSAIETVPPENLGSEKCHGFFHVFEGRTKTAVFLVHGRVFLQIGEERWDWLADRVRIGHRRRGLGVTIKDSVYVYAAGQTRFEAVYSPAVGELLRLGEMTVDGIDETSDWWLWLARIVAEAKHREQLVVRWRAGV